MPALPGWQARMPALPGWQARMPALPGWQARMPALPGWQARMPTLPGVVGLMARELYRSPDDRENRASVHLQNHSSHFGHALADGKARGQSGRFDADEMDD